RTNALEARTARRDAIAGRDGWRADLRGRRGRALQGTRRSIGKGALGCESWRADQRLSDYLRGQREAIRCREHRSVTGRGCRREDDARAPSKQREPDVRLCASLGSQVLGGWVAW